ncbi:NADH-quinone oxidoreductase subunit NuoG [Acidomonas methanolica]|uniref:NADH-quinone oxidoreductase n=1 Tax=Acidomonas methanolica NBRC 104435 TaxID=1231351 RepID=A0A023D2W2_ACIMT|nr:NADH-quinone oxidoreductase subunit NuoG [Acidomonas methanolica]MBU2655012.1 NADH-quinone oxidoreductase subunit NuoG [Acidomonas methanolica]TCS25673.1 NADH dehydrogenase subunit G [Acidomonas methanolica]GAJ28472.1 NADH-quinone oxidoreductase subunit G [Acidomonas methanolica NBRC 104435]GBQ45213.1 NADH-quinone oxidoreductase subunit G [Acidomonas methanolica]GEK99484.1 NADH-quinone oxidoreductase [Acidomonas methanolica NBRC 104435]
MAKITIDGRVVEARDGGNLLQACLEAGTDLPYFCWHPELGSVGACRQCAVKQYANADDKRGRIVMACMTPVTEGAILSVDDPEAKEFRGEVVEWLMTNHPHDCPVCEEGGECHLQDMTVMTGHRERRFRFDKRTHRNQDLGPFVKHEMNRCIACYRCVRFYKDYAGGEDLGVFAQHNNVYFGRQESGTLESPFAGNLIEVCPTGVFTDKPFSRMYSRKWDMRGAPSVCTHCSVGCSTILNERAGKVRRTLNRYNDEVNRYFLCDRGRFGNDFVNAPSRLRAAGYVMDGRMTPVPPAQALTRFAEIAADGPIFGVMSGRASVESNLALRRLVGEALAGEANVSTGWAEPLHGATMRAVELLRSTPARVATLQEIEHSDGLLILGEDVDATAPRLALAAYQTQRNAFNKLADANRIPHWLEAPVRTLGAETLAPLYIATPAPVALDKAATLSVRALPDDIARLGFAIANCIDPAAPGVSGLGEDETQRAAVIADALLAAERPVIVSGTQYASVALIEAAANIAAALAAKGKAAGLSLVLPEANAAGIALLGGMSLDALLEKARAGQVGTLVVLERDLARQMPQAGFDALLGAVRHLVVIDHSVTPTAERGELVLPATAVSECGGTMVSMEGRAQRFLQVVYPEAPLQVGWRWLRDMAEAAGIQAEIGWQTLDQATEAVAAEAPVFAAIREAAPEAGFMLEGEHIRSQTSRVSGRTAIRANISVHDIPPPFSPDTPLASDMEGSYAVDMPGALVPFYRVPGWNSEQSLNKFQQEIGGRMRGGDSGVRLFPGEVSAGGYVGAVPTRADGRGQTGGEAACLVLPAYEVFGSDETSMASEPVKQRAGEPVVRIGGHGASGVAVLEIGGDRAEVAVTVDPALPEGVIFCPPYRVIPGFATPAWGSLRMVEAEAVA